MNSIFSQSVRPVIGIIEAMRLPEDIQQLPMGVAIICGGGIQVPLFIRIRPRETRHGGESVKIIEG